jgi:hypothetical protein
MDEEGGARVQEFLGLEDDVLALRLMHDQISSRKHSLAAEAISTSAVITRHSIGTEGREPSGKCPHFNRCTTRSPQ